MNEEKVTVTIVQATPGWSLGEYEGTPEEIEGADTLDYRPIVAWEVERAQDEWHPSCGYPPGTERVTYRTFPICAGGIMTVWQDAARQDPIPVRRVE
jgi:hypothetical protein